MARYGAPRANLGDKAPETSDDMIQVPINGGAYALGAQTGGCGAGPASTTDPVLAVFDFFCGVQGVETTALQALDVPCRTWPIRVLRFRR